MFFQLIARLLPNSVSARRASVKYPLGGRSGGIGKDKGGFRPDAPIMVPWTIS